MFTFLKIILARLGLIKLVWLRDLDDELTLSVKRKLPNGRFRARRLLFTGAKAILHYDGTCTGCSFVKEWRDYKPEHGITGRKIQNRDFWKIKDVEILRYLERHKSIDSESFLREPEKIPFTEQEFLRFFNVLRHVVGNLKEFQCPGVPDEWQIPFRYRYTDFNWRLMRDQGEDFCQLQLRDEQPTFTLLDQATRLKRNHRFDHCIEIREALFELACYRANDELEQEARAYDL